MLGDLNKVSKKEKEKFWKYKKLIEQIVIGKSSIIVSI